MALRFRVTSLAQEQGGRFTAAVQVYREAEPDKVLLAFPVRIDSDSDADIQEAVERAIEKAQARLPEGPKELLRQRLEAALAARSLPEE